MKKQTREMLKKSRIPSPIAISKSVINSSPDLFFCIIHPAIRKMQWTGKILLLFFFHLLWYNVRIGKSKGGNKDVVFGISPLQHLQKGEEVAG